jgi:hypothetical protein
MTIHDLWNECVDKTNDVSSCLELYTKEIRKQLIEEVKNLKNPYPKDIFVWDNDEKIEIRNDKNLIDVVITRGRFNQFIFQVVENTRQDVIKSIEELNDDAP